MLLILLVLVFFCFIVLSLMHALFSFVRADKHAFWLDLAIRMGLTVGLFGVLMLGWYLGWWQPNTFKP